MKVFCFYEELVESFRVRVVYFFFFKRFIRIDGEIVKDRDKFGCKERGCDCRNYF